MRNLTFQSLGFKFSLCYFTSSIGHLSISFFSLKSGNNHIMYITGFLWRIKKMCSMYGTPLQYSCLENPMDRGALVGCSPWGCWESDTNKRLHSHFSLSCIGEGNGNPLQYSFLENPRDGEAWWAAIYGVTQSQTRLK